MLKDRQSGASIRSKGALETPILKGALVKDLATHHDLGALSPVQRRKTERSSLHPTTFGKAFFHGWSPPLTLVS